MDVYKIMKIGASALLAQRKRMEVLSSNLANLHTTRTPQGGPYRRRDVLFQAEPVEGEAMGVKVVGIVEDRRRPFRVVYDPGHPDADENGYVRLPNVNLMEEMINMVLATRSYEAALKVISTAEEMALRTIDILGR